MKRILNPKQNTKNGSALGVFYLRCILNAQTNFCQIRAAGEAITLISEPPIGRTCCWIDGLRDLNSVRQISKVSTSCCCCRLSKLRPLVHQFVFSFRVDAFRISSNSCILDMAFIAAMATAPSSATKKQRKQRNPHRGNAAKGIEAVTLLHTHQRFDRTPKVSQAGRSARC